MEPGFFPRAEVFLGDRGLGGGKRELDYQRAGNQGRDEMGYARQRSRGSGTGWVVRHANLPHYRILGGKGVERGCFVRGDGWRKWFQAMLSGLVKQVKSERNREIVTTCSICLTDLTSS